MCSQALWNRANPVPWANFTCFNSKYNKTKIPKSRNPESRNPKSKNPKSQIPKSRDPKSWSLITVIVICYLLYLNVIVIDVTVFVTIIVITVIVSPSLSPFTLPLLSSLVRAPPLPFCSRARKEFLRPSNGWSSPASSLRTADDHIYIIRLLSSVLVIYILCLSFSRRDSWSHDKEGNPPAQQRLIFASK